jgi:hypothetical protein
VRDQRLKAASRVELIPGFANIFPERRVRYESPNKFIYNRFGRMASDSLHETQITPVMETESRPVPWRFHVELQIATYRDRLELRMSSKSNINIVANVWMAGDICNLDGMLVMRI